MRMLQKLGQEILKTWMGGVFEYLLGSAFFHDFSVNEDMNPVNFQFFQDSRIMGDDQTRIIFIMEFAYTPILSITCH